MQELTKSSSTFEVSQELTTINWISGLCYQDLMMGDMFAGFLAEWLLRPEGGEFGFTMVDGEEHYRFQLYLRCWQGLDFCRERVPGRRKFDWDQKPTLIYKHLLIELFRSEALYWIHHCYDEPESQADRNFRTARKMKRQWTTPTISHLN